MQVKGGASGCHILHQFVHKVFMSYHKLWPICRHKQLNERINIDDMLQAYGRNIRPPQAIGPFHASSPTLSSEMCVCMEQRWRGKALRLLLSESDL